MSKPDLTGMRWYKSSRSQGNGECVEVTVGGGWVGVRDSKLGEASPILALTPTVMKSFLVTVKRSGI